MALHGSFADTEPEDLLQILALGGKTGLLTVTDGARRIGLAFRSGMIVDAWDGVIRGTEVVYSLLGTRSGTFAFTSQEVVAEQQTIDRDVASLLLTGAHELDDLNQARSLLPQPTARPQLLEGAEARLDGLAGEDRAVVALIDGQRTLGEIASGSGLSLRQVYVTMGRLVEGNAVGLVTAADDDSPLSAQGAGAANRGVGLPMEVPGETGAPTPSEIREIIAYLRGS